jgi:aminoglycoside phosphotransferase (APT) family kinase protein
MGRWAMLAPVSDRMHADELEIDEELVRRLVDTQLPQWRAEPLTRVARWGTDNAMYRLGDDLVVRLPRRAAGGGLAKELEWIPQLAPYLPVPVSEPVTTGGPAHGYPCRWAVYRWLDGTPALEATVVDHDGLAADVAGFVRALQAIEVPDEVVPGSRGAPLAQQDAAVRAWIAQLAGEVDTEAVTGRWEHALAAPVWDGRPVWLHGDLMPTNLILRDGRLAGVVDWGTCTTGDPACEAMLAWMALDAGSRPRFRSLLAYDDATWARARGWAVSSGVGALAYYRETYPVFAELGRRTLAAVLADDLE